MGRRVVLLSVVAGLVAMGIAGAADEDEKSPLAKLMLKIDKETKLIRAGTKSRARFKSAQNGKDIAKVAGALAKYTKDFRDLKGPSEKMKKPFAKWTDLADRFEAAAKDMEKAASAGDFAAAQKAWNPLYASCSNCHGAFRPEVGDGF